MESQLRLNWQFIVEEAKQRRKEQSLTQQKLALLAEVSTPTISRLESGDENIEISSVLKILGALGMSDGRRLSFEKPKAKYDPAKMAVIFFGQDGKKVISCSISFEVLTDHFVSYRDPLKIFENNQEKIEHAARRKYLGGQVEKDGSVLVRSEDF